MSDIGKKLNLVLAGLLIATLLATAVACQQAGPEPTETPAEAPTEAPVKEEEEAGGQLQLAVSAGEAASPAQTNLARRQLVQKLFFGLLWFSGLLAVGILLAVVGYVVVQGAKVVNLEFLTTPPAGGLATSDVGGMSTTVVSTTYLVFWTIVVAGPLGILAAVYLVEYAEEMEGTTGW
ncbi:MAG: hypothetical protein PVG71_05360 [Anaerolineae bacterium]|jgi:hypothetical protein